MSATLDAVLSVRFPDGSAPEWVQKFRSGVQQLEALVARTDTRVAAEVAAEVEQGEELEEVRDREREAEDASMAASALDDLLTVSTNSDQHPAF
jgi:hypothetical protein